MDLNFSVRFVVRTHRLAVGVFLGAMMVSGGVMAQVLVSDGDTLVVPPDISEQVQLGDGATLLVEQGGTVTSSTAAVTASSAGTSVAVDNNGTIRSTGIPSALDMQVSTLHLINRTFGLIEASSNAAVHAHVVGSLINSGAITGRFYGVNALDSIVELTNSGLIEGGEHAVFTDGSIGELTNSGTIEGHIQGGVTAIGSIDELTNSGIIEGGELGVASVGSIGQLTNSGTIKGGIYAIVEYGGGDTLLTLLAGSVIDGAIDLGGGTNTLVVGNGLSMATTFDDAPPVIGTTNGAPYTIQGNTVIVGDATNLAMQGAFLGNLTDGIFSALDGAMLGGSAGERGTAVQPLGYAAKPDQSEASLPGLITDGNGPAIAGPDLFVRTFGTFGRQTAQTGTSDAFMGAGGVVGGLETSLNSQMRAGFFGGTATGMVQSGNGAQQTGTQSFFGGVTFEMNSDGTGVDLKLLGGYNGNDRTRQVANNLVAGGIEDAQASYHGWFIAPDLTVSQHLGDSPLIASATLGYIGAWLDGFDETGSSGNMSVEARAVQIAHARLELAMPVLQDQMGDAHSRVVVNGGVEGRVQLGDGTIEGTLAGDDFIFDAGGGTNFAAFAGLNGTYQLDGGALINGSVNGRVGLDGSMAVNGNVGVSQSF